MSSLKDLDIERIHDVIKDTSWAQPMKVKEIAERTGIHESHPSCPRVRKLVKDVMKTYNMPIGADHRGYYRIRTGQEMQRYLNLLLQRQVAISDTIDICYEAFLGRYTK